MARLKKGTKKRVREMEEKQRTKGRGGGGWGESTLEQESSNIIAHSGRGYVTCTIKVALNIGNILHSII